MSLNRPSRLPGPVGHPAPQISVIVPIYNVEDYLAECLDSLLAQTFEDFEAILVDDGSLDRSGGIGEEYAARDDRFRVVTRPNGGLGAARNTGIREARGRYLTFVDSDDLLPPDALAVMVGSAEQTGSDVVCGAVQRFDSRRRWSPPWVAAVHRERRLAITIDEHPELVRNLYTWDKLFRRGFFNAQGLWFREGVSYEDQPIITQLFGRAGSIDVLPEVVYRYRRRDDLSSISQQTATLPDLVDRVRAWELSREVLVPELSRHTWEAWLQTLFEAHFLWYLTSPGTADDAYWRILQGAVADLSAEAPAWVWEATSPAQRIMVRLAQLDRRADVRAFVESGGMRLDPWPAEVRADGIRLGLPYADDPDVPGDLALLRPEQMLLAQRLEHVQLLPGNRLLLSGWAYLRKLDLSQYSSHVTVQLRHTGSGEVRSFRAGAGPTPVYDPPTDDPWCDHRSGRFAVEVGLPEAGEDDGWEVWLRVEAAGFSAEGPAVDGTDPVVLRADRPPLAGPPAVEGPIIQQLSVSAAGELTVVGCLAEPATEVRLTTRDQRARVEGPAARVEEGGAFTATLPLSRERYGYGHLPFAPGHRDLMVVVDGGEEMQLRPAEGLARLLPVPLRTDLLEGRVTGGPDGALRLTLVRPLGQDRGAYTQRLLVHAETGPVEPAILLDTVHAEALLAQVRRCGVGLPVYWVVPDHSAPVPPGVSGVIRGSARFHALVGTASRQVFDESPAGWALPRPGRRRLRTFDTFPALPDRELAVEVGPCDLVVSPAPWVTGMLGSDVPVLTAGSPRLDAVHAGNADERRRLARDRLGVTDQQVVVLHHPEGGSRLRAGPVARALGKRFVVLVRGRVGKAPRCLDVSDHPSPVDLLLAADAVVTGSSSLLLDAVAAGRPVLLLDPDDPGVHPPGPVLHEVEEVVAALSDLDRVRSEHAAAYSRLREQLGLEDGRAAERVVDALLREAEEA